jgi:hypothetical protein
LPNTSAHTVMSRDLKATVDPHLAHWHKCSILHNHSQRHIAALPRCMASASCDLGEKCWGNTTDRHMPTCAFCMPVCYAVLHLCTHICSTWTYPGCTLLPSVRKHPATEPHSTIQPSHGTQLHCTYAHTSQCDILLVGHTPLLLEAKPNANQERKHKHPHTYRPARHTQPKGAAQAHTPQHLDAQSHPYTHPNTQTLSQRQSAAQ